MAFSDKTLKSINGWGAVLRFVTPLMVGLLLAMYGAEQRSREAFRADMKLALKEISAKVSLHLEVSYPILLERVSKIEARIQRGRM